MDPLSILLVEDNPGDVRLLESYLWETSFPWKMKHTSYLEKAVQLAASEPCDVCLLDLSLPDGFGLDTVTKMYLSCPLMPIVVMTPVGAGIHGSVYHSHSFDAWATRLPGWKVVMPSNPLEAYGLMLSAIEDPNPVLFLKPKALLRVKGDELIPGEPADERELKAMIDAPIGDRSKWRPKWPNLEKWMVPIGKARVTREGTQVSVVTYGRHVAMANQVADERGSGKVEVIDLRSLYPYDWTAIRDSVRKTGRVIFLNEDTEVTNFGEHLAYRVTRELFYELQARPLVLAGKNLPGIGLHPNLENASVPSREDLLAALDEVIGEVP